MKPMSSFLAEEGNLAAAGGRAIGNRPDFS
jgi:hypothetical protein